MPHTSAITVSARSWVGTKFHHQGRLKKTDAHRGGVDCLGLLVGVAKECELKGRSGELLHLLDETDYSHTPDVTRLYTKLQAALIAVPKDQLQEGDVVLMHVLNSPQHLGVVGWQDGPTLIHAYAQAGAVIEHSLDAYWQAMVKAAFRVP